MVPRDIPGVTGAPISGGCNSRISPTSVSGHIGSIQLPWHRGMPRTCQRTKTFSMTVWIITCLQLFETHKKMVRSTSKYLLPNGNRDYVYYQEALLGVPTVQSSRTKSNCQSLVNDIAASRDTHNNNNAVILLYHACL